METFSALLAPFVWGIHRSPRTPPPPPPPAKTSVTGLWCFSWSVPEQRLSKQSRRWWFETPLRSLWRRCNVPTVRTGSQDQTTSRYCFWTVPTSQRTLSKLCWQLEERDNILDIFSMPPICGNNPPSKQAQFIDAWHPIWKLHEFFYFWVKAIHSCVGLSVCNILVCVQQMCKNYKILLHDQKSSQRYYYSAVAHTHHSDVIMSVMASQVTSVSIVYSIVCCDADQRKHQSFASLPLVRGIRRRPVDSHHKGPVTRKMIPFDDVIMQQLGFV